MAKFTEAELEAYLDEHLDAARASEIEQALRQDKGLHRRLAHINARRNSGVHTLGEIWRGQRLCVPTREELGSYLLGVLLPEHAAYIQFRIEVLKCPYTIANLRDLESKQKQEQEAAKSQRRQRIFQSSIGHLKDDAPQ